MTRSPIVLLFYQMTYTIVSWKEGAAWSSMCPSIPGVFGLGRTRKAAEKDFAAALRTLLDYLDEIGEEPPPPQPVQTTRMRVA